MFRLVNQTTQQVIAERVSQATRVWDRMKGLLGYSCLLPGQGLWIQPCRSIHTFFMRFSIDAVFVSSKGIVVRVFPNLVPFRVTPFVWKAQGVIELPEGTLKKSPTHEGDQLCWEDQP